jgi:hypothetical protein
MSTVRVRRVSLAVAWIGTLMACRAPAGDKAAALTTEPAHNAPPVAVRSVLLSPSAAMLVPGLHQGLVVTVLGADGRTLTDRTIVWTTSDPGVAIVSPMMFTGAKPPRSPDAMLFAVRSGSATITATVDGVAARMSVSVDAPSGSETGVVVDGFSVVEYEYASAPGKWNYAPLVRFRNTMSQHAAEVIAFSFSIPGFNSAPGFVSLCGTSLYLAPDQSADLFHEIYGDYQFEFGPSDQRANGDSATATFDIRDDNGKVAQLVVRGPVVAGGLPTTYTGGTPATPISC